MKILRFYYLRPIVLRNYTPRKQRILRMNVMLEKFLVGHL